MFDETLLFSPICFCVLKEFFKKVEFFLFFNLKSIFFLVFLDHFNALILKLIFFFKILF